MKITSLPLQGVLLVEATPHGDERGLFCETYRQDALAEAGFKGLFVQENVSRSARRGTVRGLHFQAPPYAQDKLIRVARGAILDVVVDIRRGSPTYGQAFTIKLSADDWRQLLIPQGFAHGFCALNEDCEVIYKVSATYAPKAAGGLLWSDPALAVDWPVSVDQAILNARDAAWPALSALQSPFRLDDAGGKV